MPELGGVSEAAKEDPETLPSFKEVITGFRNLMETSAVIEKRANAVVNSLLGDGPAETEPEGVQSGDALIQTMQYYQEQIMRRLNRALENLDRL